VIPAHNAARTLAHTLGSLVAQTVQPNEVILVDDGSTDATAAIASDFLRRLPNLRVISVRHQGVSAARNTAIHASRSDYIAPLDSDDVWHPTYLEKMLTRCKQAGDDLGFVYCLFRSIDLGGQVISSGGRYEVEGSGFYQMLVFNYVGNGSGAVFLRSRALSVGLYDENRTGNEDFLVHLRLAWAGTVHCVPEYLVGYRDVPGSLSKRYAYMSEDQLKLLASLPAIFPGIDPLPVRWSAAAIHSRYVYIILILRDGRLRDVPLHLLMAARLDLLGELARWSTILWGGVMRRLSPPMAPVRHFTDFTPYEAPGRVRYRSRLKQCAVLDASAPSIDRTSTPLRVPDTLGEGA
jgi:glycosyltransferase involved in cell wall biosynthesis